MAATVTPIAHVISFKWVCFAPEGVAFCVCLKGVSLQSLTAVAGSACSMDVVGHKYESFVQREMQKRAAALRKEVRGGVWHTAAAQVQQGAVGVLLRVIKHSANRSAQGWVSKSLYHALSNPAGM